jgi:hemerythrin
MAYFEWIKDFATGSGEMDSEHKQLINIMNKLYDQNQSKLPYGTLRQTLIELGDYTKKHFSEEETYMATIKFPKLDIHKRIHADLLAKFTEHFNAAEQTKTINEGLFKFLQVWLSAHIRGIDKQYGEHTGALKKAG